jgi:hypothetical protein
MPGAAEPHQAKIYLRVGSVARDVAPTVNSKRRLDPRRLRIVIGMFAVA